MTRDELERFKVRLRLGQPFDEDDIQRLIEAAEEEEPSVYYCPGCDNTYEGEEP